MRILWCSDNGVPTGFGRIADEVCTRLFARGIEVAAASYTYDGLLPATYEGQRLPYHVASLVGGPDYAVTEIGALVNAIQPDIVVVCQDFPYSQTLRFSALDWSRYGLVIITPVDGMPIYPAWLDTMRLADAGMTISAFGVNAFRQHGIEVGLCRPGVNLNKFYRLPEDERHALRQRAGLEADAFVLGVVCMNQGRKAIPSMLRGFFTFAMDKPKARLILDMEKISPAGWDIPAMCLQFGWPVEKLLFREDLLRCGITELRERYALMDAHAVLSNREGFGLPLVEAQACGVVSMASDYCSGPEIVGDGKGVLIKTLDAFAVSTWGNALDRLPDDNDFGAKLQWLYDNPAERAALAEKGMAAARSHTWDHAADAVQATLLKVYEKRKALHAAP